MITWTMFIFIFLQVFTLFSLILGLLSTSLINFLLYTVLIILFQGLTLLLVKNTILGLYLLIIYLGAIVILFAFMVLFVNNSTMSDTTKKIGKRGYRFIYKEKFLLNYKNYISNFFTFMFTFVLWIWVYIIYYYHSVNSLYNIHVSCNSENIIYTIAEHIYESNSFALLIMTAIMATGLILTILVIKRRK